MGDEDDLERFRGLSDGAASTKVLSMVLSAIENVGDDLEASNKSKETAAVIARRFLDGDVYVGDVEELAKAVIYLACEQNGNEQMLDEINVNESILEDVRNEDIL